MEKLLIFINVISIILFFMLGFITFKMCEVLDELNTKVTKLSIISDNLDYTERRVGDLCDQHEDDITKIKAEVLAADILKDKEM